MVDLPGRDINERGGFGGGARRLPSVPSACVRIPGLEERLHKYPPQMFAYAYIDASPVNGYRLCSFCSYDDIGITYLLVHEDQDQLTVDAGR